jgi:hypothetical protein
MRRTGALQTATEAERPVYLWRTIEKRRAIQAALSA